MLFCYPEQTHTTLLRGITLLACSQIIPPRPQTLASVLHFIADDTALNRLSSDSSCIRPGSSVELHNIRTNQTGWLQLVLPTQACYHKARISLLSPLGCALLGKAPDTEIRLTILRQPFHFRVLTVLNVKHTKLRSHP
jgi:hypothetical protein